MHSPPPTSYRPLHLVASPTSTGATSFFDDSNLNVDNDASIRAAKMRRRQSTISYISPSHSRQSSLSSTASPPPPRRPRPLSLALPSHSSNDNDTNEGGGGVLSPVQTVSETYAPLLQFIAQKESKCLELRSQLAQHEQELALLKRKWEKIVSRHQAFPPPLAPAPAVGKKAMMKGLTTALSRPSTPPKEEEDTLLTPALTPSSARSTSSSYSHSSASPTESTPSSFLPLTPPLDGINTTTKNNKPRLRKPRSARQPVLEDFGASPTPFPNPARLPSFPSSSSSSSNSSPKMHSAPLPGTGLATFLPTLSKYTPSVASDLSKLVSPSSAIWKQQRRASKVLEGVSAVLWSVAFKEPVEELENGTTTIATSESRVSVAHDGKLKEDETLWNW